MVKRKVLRHSVSKKNPISTTDTKASAAESTKEQELEEEADVEEFDTAIGSTPEVY